MKNVSALAIFCGISCVLGHGTSSAQELGESNYIEIDGSKEPDRIPSYMKYDVFFGAYQDGIRPRILDHLAPGDDAVLIEVAAGNAAFRMLEINKHESDVVNLCSAAGKIPPREYIRRREQSAENSNQRLAAHYDAALARLSSKSRKVIEEFIETNITRNMVTSLPKEPLWEVYDNETAQEEFEIDCYYAVNGRYPPEVQEQMKKAAADALAEFREDLQD